MYTVGEGGRGYFLKGQNFLRFRSKQYFLTKKKENKKNKKEKVTESLHLMVEMTRMSGYKLNLRKFHFNKTTVETTKQL